MDEQGQEPADQLTLDAPTTLRSPKPRALWAVLAFLGLAAGGLVVSAANDDGGRGPGLPVDLAWGSRSAPCAAPSP